MDSYAHEVKELGIYDTGSFRIGNETADLSNMTYGVSHKGMEAYRQRISSELYSEIWKKLDSVAEIQRAIDSGWQGLSRDKFYNDFIETVVKIRNDIDKEFQDLNARLVELEMNYFKQDEELTRSDY